MSRKIWFLLLCLLLTSFKVQSNVKGLASETISLIKDKNARDDQWLNFIFKTLQNTRFKALNAKKATIEAALQKYCPDSKEALTYFTENVYQARLKHPKESEIALTNAIHEADKTDDDYLVFKFLNFLAYSQTEEGDVIGAVSSYRMAKKYAIKLKDIRSEIVTDINVSDVFYKNEFYKQSLFYLEQATRLNHKYSPADQRINNVIYYNKCESFFKLNQPDSLKLYNAKLKNSPANTNKLFTYQNRTDYYLYLLNHDYTHAIGIMRAMRPDKRFDFNDRDLQNLSEAYFMNGQADSAELITDRLLTEPSLANHPEIKYHLYSLLGKIAEQRGNYKTAAINFKLSLQQSQDNMNRITQVNDISSLIKVDELENYYLQKDEIYQRERAALILAIIFALLIVLVITVFYRTVKQKRHYEKLLFTAKKQELAFINSHDVRKHLANIMGLVDVLGKCKNKEKEFDRAKQYLYNSSQNLDKAIKNIAEKIDS